MKRDMNYYHTKRESIYCNARAMANSLPLEIGSSTLLAGLSHVAGQCRH